MRNFTSALLALLFALLPFSAAAQAQQARAARSSGEGASATAAALSTATLEAARQITAARLKEHLSVVASDAMVGRDTPSRGLDETA